MREMLDEAAFWRTHAHRPPLDTVLNEPNTALYVQDRGRRGDDGLIARVGNAPVGAVWVPRFEDDSPGYGYVDESTPESSIGVAQEYRGRGIGRCLIAAMLVQLRLRGYQQVSLSVETDNPARGLYESLAFTQTSTTRSAVTMVSAPWQQLSSSAARWEPGLLGSRQRHVPRPRTPEAGTD